MNETSAPSDISSHHDQSVTTGRWVVLLMFAFAAMVTAGLWLYWELHTRPFQELTNAIADQYPGSSPRVEGGKHGMHRETAAVLRIVVRIDYLPEKNPQRHQQDLATLINLAALHVNLMNYDRCDLHLFRHAPEREPVITTTKIDQADFPIMTSP